MLVQIYEVRTLEEALALARLGIDHIGVLVGGGAFPRELPPTQATAIFAAIPAGTRQVALSLSPQLREIARVVEQTRPDIVHIGGAPWQGGAFQWVQVPPGDSLPPEAIGAVMEVTKWLKPSISGSRIGDRASVQAATRVNAEQASKRTMCRPTRRPLPGKADTAG